MHHVFLFNLGSCVPAADHFHAGKVKQELFTEAILQPHVFKGPALLCNLVAAGPRLCQQYGTAPSCFSAVVNR